MAATGYRRIAIKPASPFGPIQDEGLAAAALTPGELLEVTSSGKLGPHSSSGGAVGVKRVCLETIHADGEGTDQINIDYASADVVYYAQAQPGDVYYMFLAGSQDVSAGDFLESDGAGALQAVTPGTDDTAGSLVAQAEEDKDNSTNGSRVRIKARIL